MCNIASTEMATSKQKQSDLILVKKIELIREIERGKYQRCVAEIFEMPKSTIGDIWKDREKISCHVFSADDLTVTKRRCIVRGSQFSLLDDPLSMWFLPSEIRIFPSYRWCPDNRGISVVSKKTAYVIDHIQTNSTLCNCRLDRDSHKLSNKFCSSTAQLNYEATFTRAC